MTWWGRMGHPKALWALQFLLEIKKNIQPRWWLEFLRLC